MPLKVKLTKEQEKHFPSLEWLFNDRENRATGRTFLLSCMFITEALRAGDWVRPVDLPKTTDYRRNRYILDQIEQLLIQGNIPYEISHARQEFRVKIK